MLSVTDHSSMRFTYWSSPRPYWSSLNWILHLFEGVRRSGGDDCRTLYVCPSVYTLTRCCWQLSARPTVTCKLHQHYFNILKHNHCGALVRPFGSLRNRDTCRCSNTCWKYMMTRSELTLESTLYLSSVKCFPPPCIGSLDEPYFTLSYRIAQ
jgi:hypothetical protein